MFALDEKVINKIQKLQNSKIINKGRTSLILEHENENFLKCLTRDKMKYKWYNTINFGHLQNIYTIEDKKDKFFEYPIYEIDVPKLSPLSFETRRLLRHFLMYVKKIRKSAYSHSSRIDEQNIYIVESLSRINSIFQPNIELLHSYTQKYAKEFILDLNMYNVMQMKEQIVYIDPVFSFDLLRIFLPDTYQIWKTYME